MLKEQLRAKLLESIINGYYKSHKAGCICTECALTRLFLYPHTVIKQCDPVDIDAFQKLLSRVCFSLDELGRRGRRGNHPHFISDVVFALVLKWKESKSARAIQPMLLEACEVGLVTKVVKHNTIIDYANRPSTLIHLQKALDKCLQLSGDSPVETELLTIDEYCRAITEAILNLMGTNNVIEIEGEHVVQDAASLIATVEHLVPKTLPFEKRADVCQEIVVAVLSGEVTMDEIKEKVRFYVRKIYKLSADKYKHRSLDHPITGDDGATLGERLEG
jgi:hypothetical protein